MRTLGIDPGTYNMGVGVVRDEEGALSVVDAAVLKAPRRLPIAQRLYRLYTELLSYIARNEPQEIAIEEPFVARNVRSAIAVGQARAVAMVAAAAAGVCMRSYTPREVKLSVTGFGDSSKEQVRDMIALTLNADASMLPLDASDALAVAVCHINARRAESLTAEPRK